LKPRKENQQKIGLIIFYQSDLKLFFKINQQSKDSKQNHDQSFILEKEMETFTKILQHNHMKQTFDYLFMGNREIILGTGTSLNKNQEEMYLERKWYHNQCDNKFGKYKQNIDP